MKTLLKMDIKLDLCAIDMFEIPPILFFDFMSDLTNCMRVIYQRTHLYLICYECLKVQYFLILTKYINLNPINVCDSQRLVMC